MSDLNVPLVLLSAGHNLKDPGAVVGDTTEHEICARLAFYVAGFMNEESRIILPGTLAQKIQRVNEIVVEQDLKDRECLAIELHLDSAASTTASGMTVFHHAFGPAEGAPVIRTLAEEILKHMAYVSWVKSRGVKTPKDSQHSSLGWVDKTACRALLIECGFLTNPEAIKVIRDPIRSEQFARRLADAIDRATIHLGATLANNAAGRHGFGRGVGGKHDAKAWRESKPQIEGKL